MTSREKILNQVKLNQPALQSLPPKFEVQGNNLTNGFLIEQFTTVLNTIGGTVIRLDNIEGLDTYLIDNFKNRGRVISTIQGLSFISETEWRDSDPHLYENIDLAILTAHFAVAENAALWITEDLMHQRVIPFICQQLAVVISASSILPSMHHAYDLIADAEYGFGTFIAGPSKTADIEQSLVLGAHGPKSMIVFLIP